jgi:hypothetical protein
MLRQIRNQSQNVVVLALFGMLIFVFIFFFGLPNQMGNGEASLFNQWGAKINGDTFSVADARLYAVRRANSNENLNGIKDRLDEMVAETLLDRQAQSLGFVIDDQEASKKLLNPVNLDLNIFLEENVNINSAFDAYKAKKEAEGINIENLPSDEVFAGLLETAYQGKINANVLEGFENTLQSWGLRDTKYLELKAKEFRTREYISFLKSQILPNEAEAQFNDEISGQKFVFSFVKIPSDWMIVSSTFSADQIAKTQAEKAKEIEVYYNQNISQFSKSKLQATEIKALYQDPSKLESAKAILAQVKSKMLSNPALSNDEVAKEFSNTDIVVVVEPSIKSRSNTKKETIQKWFALNEKDFSEVEQGFNSVNMIRVDKKEMGEEKTIDQSREEIARKLLELNGKGMEAENQAKQLVAHIQAKQDINTWLDRFNQTLNPTPAEGSTENQADKVVNKLSLSMSGEISLADMTSGNLAGIFYGNKEAGDTLINNVFKLTAGDVIAQPLKNAKDYYVVILKEKVASTESAELKAAKIKLSATQTAQSQFLGNDWLAYSLRGPRVFDNSLSFFADMYVGARAGMASSSFLDQSLETTKEYNPALLEEINKQKSSNPIVIQ